MESWAGKAAISKLDLKRPRVADPTFSRKADKGLLPGILTVQDSSCSSRMI